MHAQGRIELLVRQNRGSRWLPLKGPLLPALHLRPEQIDRARKSKCQNERDDEQPGVEMPAPDRAVEARIAHHHLNLSPANTERPVPGLNISEESLAVPAIATVAMYRLLVRLRPS